MIRLGNTGLTLCRWGENRRWSHEELVATLRQCASDPSLLLDLRALVGDGSGIGGVEAMDEDRLFSEIASLVHSGDLQIFGTPVPQTSRSGGVEQSPRNGTAPPPRSQRRAPAQANPAPPEPPILPPTVDRPALVAVMRSAAESGVPFCDT